MLGVSRLLPRLNGVYAETRLGAKPACEKAQQGSIETMARCGRGWGSLIIRQVTGHLNGGKLDSTDQAGYCCFLLRYSRPLLPITPPFCTGHWLSHGGVPRPFVLLRVLRPFCLRPHPHSETRKPEHRMRSSETSQSCDCPDGKLVASASLTYMLWWPLASSSGCWDWPQGREDGWGGRNWQAGRGEGGEPLTAEQMLVIL